MAGGTYDADGGHPTGKLEAYDAKTKRWASLAPMPTGRRDLALVAGRDGRIYAIGGSTAERPRATIPALPGLRTVEIYDPGTNRWRTGPSLHVARADPAAVMAADGRIYAIGGEPTTDAIETLAVPPPAGK